MRKRLTQIAITGTAFFSLVVAPYLIPNSYAGRQRITGGGVQEEKNNYQKKQRNWRDKSSENNPKWEKRGRKILNKINPYNKLIDATEKFSEKYNKFKKRTGNSTGTGSTIKEH